MFFLMKQNSKAGNHEALAVVLALKGAVEPFSLWAYPPPQKNMITNNKLFFLYLPFQS